VPPYYDSLIAKLIVQGRDREEAIRRMQMALESLIIEGVTTTSPFLARVMQHAQFQAGDVDTKWLEREFERLRAELQPLEAASGAREPG
jgi:acetyl-CoA carboxylase biotin carboxylase subunit